MGWQWHTQKSFFFYKLASDFFVFFFFKYVFIYLASGFLVAALGVLIFVVACGIFSPGLCTLSWGLWDLVPWPGREPRPLALGTLSLSHWTTVEVPKLGSFKQQFFRMGFYIKMPIDTSAGRHLLQEREGTIIFSLWKTLSWCISGSQLSIWQHMRTVEKIRDMHSSPKLETTQRLSWGEGINKWQHIHALEW